MSNAVRRKPALPFDVADKVDQDENIEETRLKIYGDVAQKAVSKDVYRPSFGLLLPF